MASTARYSTREAHEDAREFQIRITRCPWAYALMEVVLLAQSTADFEGPTARTLYNASEQLDGAMQRRLDVDVEFARDVLAACWAAEMEREARFARLGWERGW